jgi:hypothetical protein
MSCELCTGPLPAQRTGRPRRYCSDECSRAAEGLAALRRVLAERPQAFPGVAELLEAIPVDVSSLPDHSIRRVRAAMFTMASRGRRLAPGTSGRYTKAKAEGAPG